MNRDAIKQHATQYWYRPCRDGLVWLSHAPIHVSAEIRKRGLNSDEWTAVFLTYDVNKSMDGLYLIRKPQLVGLPANHYDAGEIRPFEDCVQVQQWSGLNDCAHFVSECLTAGGVGVWQLGVGNLVHKLRERHDTKTLAFLVDLPSAKRIVAADIMDVGDIIAFGDPSGRFVHGHSTIYMGGGKVANHTHLNHPDFTGGLPRFGRGAWEPYADAPAKHPLVILIHFSDGDQTRPSSMVGWWQMTWRGSTYYYHFEQSGRIGWTQRTPANLQQGHVSFEGKGYWFWFDSGAQVKITWTATGTLESHARTGSRISGTLNDGEVISGGKMG